MNTASTAPASGRETTQNVREAVRETRTAAGEHAGNLEQDLQALRDDFRRLAEQVAGIVTDTGAATWRQAKSRVDEALADAQDKGRDAASAVREVSDHFADALDESLKTRPYTTLAIVAGIAFVLGAAWRR
jgi:ElaB/YqjD/DUF883 family membrane-anchored ribosome-binding protein